MNRKKVIVFSVLAVIALMFFPLLTLASYQTGDKLTSKTASSYEIGKNGTFSVQVWRDGEWKDAGSLAFNRFFLEERLDLSAFVPQEGSIRIRLTEKGGGAAHIDSIMLGDKSPTQVLDVDDGLRKLARKDFDVIDAFDKSIELTFNGHVKKKVLSLTARIEEPIIAKNPFQFPEDNLFRDMDSSAHFYPYKINSRKGPISLDGHLDEVIYHSPFFKEYSATATGHPSGYTYGWVWNDDNNLYVAIDFTPDDTIDGDKDYAKVYVKTVSAVKEFKVSVPETKWGVPGFTYTDKVPYQHKVYEFQIPMTELNVENMNQETPLSLAFAAYGTGAPGGPNTICICKSAPSDTTQKFDFRSNSYPDNSRIRSDGECGCDVYAGGPFPATPTTATYWEEPLNGWHVESITCNTGNGATYNTNLTSRSVTINLTADGYATCTFTNAPGNATRTVPTMTQWGIIVFVALAGLGAIYYMRKQRRTKS